MWDLLDVSDKGDTHVEMEVEALATHVKDAKQNKTVVTERATDMGLRENVYMTYHLGQ
jgi:hypothetical protein